MLKIADYARKYQPLSLGQLRSRKPVMARTIQLPENALIHHQSDVVGDGGIRRGHPLLVGGEYPVRVYHIEDVKQVSGNPRSRPFDFNRAITTYLKQRPSRFTRVRKLDRTLREKRSVIVADYSLMNNTLVYPNAKRAFLDEYENNRATVWEQVRALRERRENFIVYTLPKQLPEYADFKRVQDEIPLNLMDEWRDYAKLGLLEVWRMMLDADEAQAEYYKNVHLVFVEGVWAAQVNLGKLLEWAEDDLRQCQTGFLALCNTLLEKRTVADSKALEAAAAAVPDEVPAAQRVVGEVELNARTTALMAEGRMTQAEEQRLKKISQTYKTITNPFGDGTLADLATIPAEELVLDTAEPIVSDKVAVVDKNMLSASVEKYHKQYLSNVLERDVAATTLSLQKAGYLVTDYQVEEVQDALSQYKVYKVKIVPVEGKPTTLTFKLPTVDAEGVYTNAGVAYRLDPQRRDQPIRKVSPFKVSLTSIASKVFINRSQRATNNFGRWFLSRLLREAATEDPQVEKVVFSNAPIPRIKLPRIYAATSEKVRSFNTAKYRFRFDYKDRVNELPETELKAVEKHGVFCGWRRNGKAPLVINEAGKVLVVEGGKATELGWLPELVRESWGAGPVEYATVNIYGKQVPAGVLMAYLMGLDKALSTFKVKHRWVANGSRVELGDSEYRIRFKDESLILDRGDQVGSMLMGGFLFVHRSIRDFAAAEFNSRGVYGHVLETVNIGRHIPKEMRLMDEMFVDPITLEWLQANEKPETFRDLIHHACELLLDDQYSDEMDMDEMLIKGYERFSGFIYTRVLEAIREHRNLPSPSRGGLSMRENAVYGDILMDTAVRLVEDSNPIHNLKEHEAVTFTGQGGRTAQTMVAKSRLYHKNDVGTISESTPDSSKVGIRTYMSPGAKLTSVRGDTARYNPKTDSFTNAVSTTALLSPSANNMDPKRVLG